MGNTTTFRGAATLAATLVLATGAWTQDLAPNERETERAEAEFRPDAYLAAPLQRALTESARDALADWGPWASDHGYEGYISQDQSTIFFALGRRSGADELRTIEAVERGLREELPTPRTRNRGPITGTGGPTTKVYPLGGDQPLWKHDLGPIDEHTGVLFELDSDEHYAEFLERVAELEAERAPTDGPLLRRHLGERSRSLLTTGAAAFVWRAGSCPDENQVAHAAAFFNLEKRFRFLPAWLRDGLAWHMEKRVAGTVRCLPDSRGETARDFHEQWGVDERVRPFEGTWVERLALLNDFGSGERYVLEAGLAYGLVRELLERPAQSLSNAAEELRLYWEDHSVRHHPRHGFQRIHDYRTPSHQQARILAPLLGDALALAD